MVAPRVQALLTESVQWTGGKQRLTATRLHELLVAEGQRVGVTVVKDAVAEWKRQRREVFVPLTDRPGDLAEVDFFEVLVDIEGVRRKAWLFLMRLMYSGRDFGKTSEPARACRRSRPVFRLLPARLGGRLCEDHAAATAAAT
jgi:hypothetical protein